MKPLRGAVFGCGMISSFHLGAWQRIPEVEIVALGNRTLSRAEARRDEFVPDARIYAELSDLLANEQLDFIDILTPPALHKPHCLLALEAGLHVICQKPIADTLTDALALTEAAKMDGRKLAIHENHRYRPWFQEILSRNRDGFFGTIRYARFEQFDPNEPAETYKLQSTRGIVMEYGTHLIDMTYALLGTPDTVLAHAFQLNPRVTGESLAHLTFGYREAVVSLDIGWKPSGWPQGGVRIVGNLGEAIYEGTMTRGETSRFRLIRGNTTIVDETRSPLDDYLESFYRFQRDIVDAMLDHGPVPQPAAENLKVLESTFAAYASIKGRVQINLKSIKD